MGYAIHAISRGHNVLVDKAVLHIYPINVIIYKAIEIIEERGKYNAERRRSPARTNVGGLLTGLIYCGECGQRLSINHTHKVVETASGPRDYLRNVYRCYRKLNARVTCEGQSTYNAERIEETVLGVVRSFFARISRVPEAAQVKAAMRREESTQAKALADAAAAVDKAAKAVAALEEQTIKALTGESQLDLGIINQLMPKQKTALEAAREEYQRILIGESGRRRNPRSQAASSDKGGGMGRHLLYRADVS